MLFKAQIGFIVLLSALGAISVQQWTVVGCLLFGGAITFAYFHEWLVKRPDWILVGAVASAIIGAGLMVGHETWAKNILAVVAPFMLAWIVRKLLTEKTIGEALRETREIHES